MAGNVTQWTPLKSFQHCRKDTDLVCFSVPNVCPLCLQQTALTEFRIPPFVLPSCFKTSKSSPRVIALRPTSGDFIRNYTETCNLHIGISDANGCIFNFDESGLKLDPPWAECLVLPMMSHNCHELWDRTLTSFIENTRYLWTVERYHHARWNCFDFVLHFIKTLSQADPTSSILSEMASMTKTEFCDNFLTRKMKKAEQYIHLYRQVLSHGCVPVKKQQ